MNYYIVTEGRSGSSLLCDYLKQLGVGHPSSWFDFRCKSQAEYQELLYSKCVNGIIGSKVSWGPLRYANTNFIPDMEAYTFLTELLPNPKWIYLTRKNKIHQALSRIKHLKLDSSHVRSDDQMVTYQAKDMALLNQPVPVDDIRDRVETHAIEAMAWEVFFDYYRIQPHRILFEDFIADKQGTLKKVCAFLGVDRDIHIEDRLRSTYSAINKKWYNRMMEGWHQYF